MVKMIPLYEDSRSVPDWIPSYELKRNKDIPFQYHGRKIIWEPNEPFRATIAFVGFEENLLKFEDLNSPPVHRRKFTMMQTDASHAFWWAGVTPDPRGRMLLTGEFEYVKRGIRYGIKWLGA